ncbi:MAG: permease-like cell division protein FtsX [Firmicutes bacterium]|nr:permease-like cell division protein FtsX [Bacillota bacterium]
MIGNLPFFLREVYLNMKRNILMTVASISTVMILALIIGFFLIIIKNLNSLAENTTSQLKIQARLSSAITRAQEEELEKKMSALAGVKSVKFISKDEALKRLQKRMKNKISLTDIGENPLPDYLEIEPASAEEISVLADKIKHFKGVDKVIHLKDLAKRIVTLNQLTHSVGLAVIAIVFIGTLFIVSNTIQLTVFARRKEIRTMQLVGAANWFIRWPFIFEGMLQGLIGALAAIIMLDLIYPVMSIKIQKSISFINLLPSAHILLGVNLTLIVLGLGIGALGSFISVNKYLKL